MATLKRLINGQDVTFDTHQAGDGQSVNWRAVHLEKKPHNKRGKIRFPLVGDEEPSSSGGMNPRDEERIKREVKNELKRNPELVKQLAETVVDSLRRFSQGQATTEDVKNAAKKLARYFELDENFITYSERYAREHFVSATSIHVSLETGHIHKIEQSAEQVTIRRVRYYILP